MKKISALAASAIAASVAFMPLSAFAYLNPSDVFGSDTVIQDPSPQSGVQAPPNPREGDDVVAEQQRRAAERRAAEQQNLETTLEQPSEDFVAPDESVPLGLFDENAQYEKRQERMDEQHGAAPTIIIGGDGTVVDSYGNVLHSGAPLVTKTGPESVLALGSMVLAAASTLAYAAIRRRQSAA